MKVIMNGYSIKTGQSGENIDHLMNWSIEGSNDRTSWEEIDRKENNSDELGEMNCR